MKIPSKGFPALDETAISELQDFLDAELIKPIQLISSSGVNLVYERVPCSRPFVVKLSNSITYSRHSDIEKAVREYEFRQRDHNS